MRQVIIHLLGFCCFICFNVTQGFSSSGLDKCNLTLSPCGTNSTFKNSSESYTCRCPPGYKPANHTCWRVGFPLNCADVDECSQSPSRCSPHGFCTNTPGSFTCQCLPGYSGAPWKPGDPHTFSCTDIDECKKEPSPCGANSICNNTSGNYTCQCSPGYESANSNSSRPGFPLDCTDINECSRCSSPCDRHSLCINTPGNFACRCHPGYLTPDGTSLYVVNPQTSNCTEKLFSCQPRTRGGESVESKCNTTSPHESSPFCTFLNKTTELLKSLWANENGNQTVQILKNIATSLYLDFNALSQSYKLGEEDVAFAATTFLQLMEDVALVTALKSKNETQNITVNDIIILTENCARKENIIKLETKEGLMKFDCAAEVANNTQGTRAVAFISYASLASVLGANFVNQSNLTGGDTPRRFELNSKVVSVTTGKHGKLSKAFNFTLKHEQSKKTNDMTVCIYWNDNTWSTEGCRLLHENSTHTTCTCDHLSSFAILMALCEHEESLSQTIITYVGLTISLVCLLLAILTFLLCRSIHNVSTSIHLHLCLCLFLADLLFLTGVKGDNKSTKACAVIAGFLHYLFLACFTWMFLEGLHLFLTVRNLQMVNYTSANRLKKRYMFPFGYGFPALIVAISAAVNHKGYETSKSCWLDVKDGFIWSFLGPVCFFIVINLSFFITVLWILRETISSLNTDVSTIKNTRLLTFKALAQLFILGCTWILGLLQTGSIGSVMAYLFTIINSLQGFFIFLVHCLLNQQVREQYKKWIRRAGKSSIRSESYGLSVSTVHSTTRVVNDVALSSTDTHTVTGASWEKTS